MFVLGVDVGLSDVYARLLDVPAKGQPMAFGDVCMFSNSLAGHQELYVRKTSNTQRWTSTDGSSDGIYWRVLRTDRGLPS